MVDFNMQIQRNPLCFYRKRQAKVFIAFERLDFHSKINHNKIGASLCKSKLSVCDESLFSFSNERDERDEDKYLIRNTGWVLWALLFKVL